MIFSCRACRAKDSEIGYLRQLVSELRGENLAFADLKTHRAVHPQAPPPLPAEDNMTEPIALSPAQIRATEYRPPVTPQEVEELFDAQTKRERIAAIEDRMERETHQ